MSDAELKHHLNQMDRLRREFRARYVGTTANERQAWRSFLIEHGIRADATTALSPRRASSPDLPEK